MKASSGVFVALATAAAARSSSSAGGADVLTSTPKFLAMMKNQTAHGPPVANISTPCTYETTVLPIPSVTSPVVSLSAPAPAQPPGSGFPTNTPSPVDNAASTTCTFETAAQPAPSSPALPDGFQNVNPPAPSLDSGGEPQLPAPDIPFTTETETHFFATSPPPESLSTSPTHTYIAPHTLATPDAGSPVSIAGFLYPLNPDSPELPTATLLSAVSTTIVSSTTEEPPLPLSPTEEPSELPSKSPIPELASPTPESSPSFWTTIGTSIIPCDEHGNPITFPASPSTTSSEPPTSSSTIHYIITNVAPPYPYPSPSGSSGSGSVGNETRRSSNLTTRTSTGWINPTLTVRPHWGTPSPVSPPEEEEPTTNGAEAGKLSGREMGYLVLMVALLLGFWGL